MLLKCNEDPALYAAGHLYGVHEPSWIPHLNDAVRRDFVGRLGVLLPTSP